MNAASHGSAQVQEGLRELLAIWQDSRQGWDDDARNYFEQHYFQPLSAEIAMALLAMGELGRILDCVERECR